MTSSLVGSEMCIRDSTQYNTHYTARSAQRRAHNTTHNTQHTTQHCTAPVSYTHLTLPTICSV
eukprot:7565514-Prorocentrum_lima.AAC.1